jgi:hypothetical protein
MSSFGDNNKVTLHGLQQEMTRGNPIAGPFTPSVCEQLFNNTHVLTKPMRSSRTSSTRSTRKMSPPRRLSSSRTSQEPIYATKSSSPAIDLLPHPTQLRTPSITKHNNPSKQEQPLHPPSMCSHPIQITPQTNISLPPVESPTPLPPQGAYGSPITYLPGSPLNSPSLSPLPPDGTTYRDCEESPQFHTAPTSFVNKTYENSPARLSEHKVVRQLEPLYGQKLA